MAMGRFLVLAGSMLALLAAAAADAADLKVDKESPILFTADAVDHDRELGIVRARGNVEISQTGRILLADTVTYNQRQDLVSATGNVSLVETTGDVLFAEHIEVTGDLKNGIIRDLRALLSDGARMAAAGGQRRDGNVTEMRKAVYSACESCREDPRRAPLWQLKAVKVRHDQREKEIEYTDAWLELGGIPVAYTPYLSHPDPTVRRKSGFLVPTIGNTSDLGFIFSLPFYWVIDDQRDVVIEPFFTSQEGPVLAVEYREAKEHGRHEFEGSVTVDSEDDFRGHVFGKLRYDLNDTWRLGMNYNRATDDTYLRRYRFGHQRILDSRAYVEGFRRRNYLAASAYAFQPLEGDVDQDTVPIVLPLVDYSFVGNPDRIGGRTILDLDLAVLNRQQGTDTRRVSARAGWDLPLRDSLGSIYTLSGRLWGDGYYVGNEEIPGEPGTFTGVTGRVWPQAMAEWRMPFVRSGETVSQIVQPVVQFVVSPRGGNPDEIPNEDSVDLELDETNLLSLDRYPGLDRVEGGARLNYGLGWEGLRVGGGSASVFAGQSYRFKADSEFTPSTGLDGRASDFVGTAEISFAPWFGVRYRTRLDNDDLDFERNEVGFGGGTDALRAGGSYVFYGDEIGGNFTSREELNLALSSRLTRHWSGRIFGTQDLIANETRRIGAGVTYEDECFFFDVHYAHDDYRDRDLEPRDTVFFRFALKTIGDVGIGF
jgi:LPS-assembly protein